MCSSAVTASNSSPGLRADKGRNNSNQEGSNSRSESHSRAVMVLQAITNKRNRNCNRFCFR
jgi:hypothetical protein